MTPISARCCVIVLLLMNKKPMNRRGISTIELLVALMVLTMALTASSFAAFITPGVVADAKSEVAAIEAARMNLVSGTSTREVALESENFLLRLSSVNWNNWQSESRTASLSSVLQEDYRPEACDPFTSGNWSLPRLVHSYSLQDTAFFPASAGINSISSLTVTPRTLSVSIGSTSQPAAPTSLFFSLTDTSAPRFIRAFDNASTSRIGNSASTAIDNTFFVGNAFGSASPSTCSDAISCAQVIVYEMREQAVSVRSSIALSMASAPYAQVSGGATAPAASLAYRDGFLYVGLQKTIHGDEFNIIDAHDVMHMRWVSGYSIGRTVTNIVIRGEKAYVSTDDPIRELMVFDVSNPANPIRIASWNAPGASTFGYGAASTVYENSIRFGRSYSASAAEFELLSLSEAGLITETGSIDSGTTKDPESVRSLLTQDRNTFMLLSHKLIVLDTHDHLHALQLATYDLPSGSTGAALACRNNQLYLGWNEVSGAGHIDVLQGS